MKIRRARKVLARCIGARHKLATVKRAARRWCSYCNAAGDNVSVSTVMMVYRVKQAWKRQKL